MKTLAICNPGLGRFSNALHVEFHTKVLQYINNFEAEKLGLSVDLVEKYSAAIEVEQGFVNHSYASTYTVEIQQALEVRNSLYRYVRSAICNARNSQNSMTVSAYNTLKVKLLNVYPALKQMGDAQKATAQIRGFVLVAEADAASQIEILGLTDALAKLKQANEKFALKYLARNSERADTGAAEMQKARTATDTVYRDVAYIVKGLSLSSSSDEATQLIYDNCAQLTARIGKLLGDWQYRLHRSQATKEVEVAPEAGSEADTDSTDASTADTSTAVSSSVDASGTASDTAAA